MQLLADNEVKHLAAQNTASQNSTNSSSSGNVGISFGTSGLMFNASGSKGSGKADGDDVSYTNTEIKAGDQITITSGGNTTLQGAVVRANQVIANIGGDLKIESLQDTSTYTSEQKNASASISIGYGNGSGSISASNSNINSDFKSVGEQSGIKAGDGGFQVNVGGNTTLTGSVIASNQAAVDQGKNSFQTGGALNISDIQNSASYDAKSVSISVGSSQQPAGKLDLSGLGIGSDKGEASSTSSAGISGIAGNTAVRSTDAEAGLKPIFDAAKVQAEINAQMQITQAFTREAPKAVASFAASQAAALRDQNNEAEAKKWDEGGIYRIALHTAVGALGGGFDGAAGAAVSASSANLMDALQDGIQQGLVAAGLSEGVAKALAQTVATLTAAGVGAAMGGAQGAATAATVDANNRQLHPDERKWAKDNAEKYRKYLAEKTGEQVSTEEAYQRLLSAGYAVVDTAAQNTGKSDELAKQFIAGNASSTLFNATAIERASPLLGGNPDGSYTPEQQARWGIRAPAEAASKLVTAAYNYVDKPCGNNCSAKYDSIVSAIGGLQQARLLYQDDEASLSFIDKQIALLQAGISPGEIVRGAAQSIAYTDKAIAFALLSGPSKIVGGKAITNSREVVIDGASGILQAPKSVEYTPPGSVVLQPKGSPWCGPAVCNMVINDAKGNIVDLNQVVGQFQGVRASGVNIIEMNQVLGQNGIVGKTTTTLSMEQLNVALANGKPVIVGVPAGTGNHFIIVDSLKTIDGISYYMTRDPYAGPRGVRSDILSNAIKANGNAVIVGK